MIIIVCSEAVCINACGVTFTRRQADNGRMHASMAAERAPRIFTMHALMLIRDRYNQQTLTIMMTTRVHLVPPNIVTATTYHHIQKINYLNNTQTHRVTHAIKDEDTRVTVNIITSSSSSKCIIIIIIIVVRRKVNKDGLSFAAVRLWLRGVYICSLEKGAACVTRGKKTDLYLFMHLNINKYINIYRHTLIIDSVF